MRADQFKSLSSIKGLADGLDNAERLMISSVKDGALGESASEFISKGGKRLRPALSLAFALSKGPFDEQALNAAAAVELIHLASLAHDALIDNDTGDRLPESADKASLLLLGDYLIAAAFSLAARCMPAVTETLAEAMKLMSEGEARTETNSLSPEYISAARQKSASLFAAACRAGGYCGGYSEKDISGFARYGELFGTAFQIVDDIKDGDIKQPDIKKAAERIAELSTGAARAISGFSGRTGHALQALPNEYAAWAVAR